MTKKKTIYGLRTRFNDSEPWSEPTYFRAGKNRDECAAMNRIIGGIRTHSFEEKVSVDEFENMLSE